MFIVSGIVMIQSCTIDTPKPEPTPTPVQCPVCQPHVCPSPSPSVKTVTKIEYRNITTIVNTTNLDRAQWYLSVAADINEGYYDDFLNKRYTDCTIKLKNTRDFVDTAVGIYKTSGKTEIAKAYENYNLAQNTIYNWCSGRADGAELSESYMSDYQSYYYDYKYAILSENETVIFKR
jgi:hypothetical protein